MVLQAVGTCCVCIWCMTELRPGIWEWEGHAGLLGSGGLSGGRLFRASFQAWYLVWALHWGSSRGFLCH